MKASLLLLALLLTMVCCHETELQKSVFLPDKDAPGLPLYSEWGYNTFGAYYDLIAFISNSTTVPAKLIIKENKLSLVFTGYRSGSYSNPGDFSMTITMPQAGLSSYKDLITLNKTVFDLTDPKYEIIFLDGTIGTKAQILNGTFEIKRAQYLLVDMKAEEVILSGVFEFQALVNGIPITVSSGRFDVGVSSNNFYKL